jgi:uncharacterized membrane protein YgcG
MTRLIKQRPLRCTNEEINMYKTLSVAASVALALIGFAASAAPSQAATRLMSSSLEGFVYRCEHHGGAFMQDGNLVGCQTPWVPVACEYFEERQAVCEWPGIANQIAVIRVIGTLPASSVGGSSSGSGYSGGGGNSGGGLLGPGDITDVPNDEPEPGFDGPSNIAAD